MSYTIYLSPPHMGGAEQRYVQETFDQGWIAPSGPSLDAFEAEMNRYIGTSAAAALGAGTAGVHLALRWFGVGPGDLVFCSDLTFIGSCDAIVYQGATPVFIDSEPGTLNMSPDALARAFAWAGAQGKMPKAVIIVDLYGESADWERLLPICREHGVPVIEDAAEAVGTRYGGKMCGSFGDVSVLSFNGNKIITTSGGGMVLSHDANAIAKMRFWSTQAREPFLHYEHKEIGYNYRMSNVCAAIGRGQLDFLPQKLLLRAQIHARYKHALTGLPAHIKSVDLPSASNYWLTLLVLDTDRITPHEIVTFLKDEGIEARPLWKPMHMQPVFAGCKSFAHSDAGFVGEDAFARMLCLPSGDGMSAEQQCEVLGALHRCLSPTLRQRPNIA